MSPPPGKRQKNGTFKKFEELRTLRALPSHGAAESGQPADRRLSWVQRRDWSNVRPRLGDRWRRPRSPSGASSV